MALQTIGMSPKRIDAVPKVIGSTQFCADRHYPGLLHIKILRSPYAHALIESIDSSAAEAMPGVVLVLTGKDLPGPFGGVCCDQDPLARHKVRFAGEPVVAVVATSTKLAAKAVKAVEVTYKQLSHVLDPLEAMKEDAPVVHEDMASYVFAGFVSREKGNIFQHFKIRKGDSEAALAAADCVVEGDYYFPASIHCQLETHSATAIYRQDDSMEMIATTQAPFVVQGLIHELYHIPYNRIKVTAPLLGGGFGGKSDVTIEGLVACVAHSLPGRYVRLVLDREELFDGTTHGRNVKMHYRMGFSKDGTLVAMNGQAVQGSGAYADYAINIVTCMGYSGTGPYYVKDLTLDIYGVYSNTPPIGAMRGYGHPEVQLAVESLMDEAAAQLGISPADIRKKNLLYPGATNGIGQLISEHSGNVAECARVITEELDKSPLPENTPSEKFGRGITCYMKAPGMLTNAQSSAFIKLNADGTVTLSTGAVDMGQGMHTALGQIAAEALDIPFDKVNFLESVDTFISPYDWQTVASRQTWGVGNALVLAAEDLKQKLREEGSHVLGATPEEITVDGGFVCYGSQKIDWGAFATGINGDDGKALTKPIMGQGHFVPDYIEYTDPETGQGDGTADWTYGSIGVELSVNIKTGVVTLHRLLNAIDAGTIINPDIATDQVKAGMLLVLGSTLSENVVYDESTGAIRTKGFTDYKIPGIEDLPEETEVFFVQTPEVTGPYGAKGLGEHGTVGMAPAILNAIADATGVRFHDLPASPQRVLHALSEGGQQ